MASSIDSALVEQSLTDLVMNCPELAELEAHLARFNIFRVLRADRAELRHSNMLAWLLQPDEGHGFGDNFLRRWLMRVMDDAAKISSIPPGWVSPIAIEVMEIDFVEVDRERESIDLLTIIHRATGAPWVICIENKVDSKQHSRQLSRYHEFVEKHYTEADRRIYILLSKHGEAPEHAEYVQSTYDSIVEVLDICLSQNLDSIGSDPRLLLQHYRQLLVDDFMDENEASRLARQIYMRHRKAIDFIIENKVDPIHEASRALYQSLQKEAAQLGIVMDVLGKGWIRFVPKEWDVPVNTNGSAWGSNSRYLLCEVGLWGKVAELQMTLGKAPPTFADMVWERAKDYPLKQEWKKRPQSFVKTYKAKSNISVKELEGLTEEEQGSRLLEWVKSELQKQEFKDAVNALAELLPHLATH